jgi:hypothetical protein
MVGLVKRLGAGALLAGILVGFPALLMTTVGNPWPDGGLTEVSLMSNSAVLGLISVLGWFVWAQLVLCTLWEIPPALRDDPEGATRLPIAAGGQQRLMRILVHTVLAVGVGSTMLLGAQPAAPSHAAAEHVAHVAHPAPETSPDSARGTTPVTTGMTDPVSSRAGASPDETRANRAGRLAVVVGKGDTLWGLAERHLCDGFRWQEIADLNQGRVMPNGRTFYHPGSIEPGWELLLPADATHPADDQHPGSETERVVERGDTLSEIAQETTGDADTWHALYKVNQDVIGDDPDLIHPGQALVLPAGDVGANLSPAPRHPGGTEDRHATNRPTDGRPTEGQRDGTATGGLAGQKHPQAPSQTPATPSQESSRPAGSAPEAPHVADPAAEAAEAEQAEQSEEADENTTLRTLLAGAICLAAGALGLTAANRRRQFRRRRVGRVIAATPAELAEVEQAIVENGSEAQSDVEFLDRALRHLAASRRVTGDPLPQLGAAVLADEDLTLLFTHPPSGEVPEGWTGTDDARAWTLPRWIFLEQDLETQPAPYPALVSIGRDERGRTWLIDLETQGMCGIQGEPQQVADLARFMVAELAVNAWSEGSEVLLADQFGAETIGLNPARLRQAQRSDALARAAALAQEMGQVEQNLDVDVLTRRRDGLLLDTTNPVVVVVASRPESAFVSAVEDQMRSRVVVVHRDEESPALELGGDGKVFLPTWGISVDAFTLPAREAEAMAALLASTRNLEDEPVPPTQSDDGPLGRFARVDGALREEYTEPRRTDGNDRSSQLPDADEVYLATGATTTEDLAAVAPSVPEDTRAAIASLDPTLDQDVADWFDESSPRPKVHLLGPVEVTALHGGDPQAIDNLSGTISFIAYLACQDRGVTGERAAAACGWKTQRTVQNRATNARFLLGTRPNGFDWLPDASLSAGARRGSAPTYELERGTGGVLNSADLFVRLKFRAQKRGDDGCEEDLVTALSLVTGAPFEAASEHRFRWLFDPGQQRHDEILVGAIHDAAHVLATRAVAEGRTDLVRLACDTARRASPHSDIAWLDQAAATEGVSGRSAASELVREQVLDRLDEDLPPRSGVIVEQRNWGVAG